MTTFAHAMKKRAAVRVVTLEPSAFADEWADRPEGPVAIGLRILSEATLETATIEAAKHVVAILLDDKERPIGDVDTRTDLYNSRLMGECIARAVCDPNDVTAPHPIFPMPEDQVIAALTPHALRYVWDVLTKMGIETSPIAPMATDDELSLLAAHIEAGTLTHLPPDEQASARKLLAAVLHPLAAIAPDVHARASRKGDEEDDDEDDVESVYRVP